MNLVPMAMSVRRFCCTFAAFISGMSSSRFRLCTQNRLRPMLNGLHSGSVTTLSPAWLLRGVKLATYSVAISRCQSHTAGWKHVSQSMPLRWNRQGSGRWDAPATYTMSVASRGWVASSSRAHTCMNKVSLLWIYQVSGRVCIVIAVLASQQASGCRLAS